MVPGPFCDPLIIVIVVAAVVVVVAAVVLWMRRTRNPDGVADFQRHIGALSSEARRPVVDQVQQLEEDVEPTPPPNATDDDRDA